MEGWLFGIHVRYFFLSVLCHLTYGADKMALLDDGEWVREVRCHLCLSLALLDASLTFSFRRSELAFRATCLFLYETLKCVRVQLVVYVL